jgi:dihydrolipoamide dehydrogenase
MSTRQTYDVTIIGAGPGGYVAALRAAQLNLDVCIIEKDNVGGTCLNRGCIPTKSILKSAELLSHIKNAKVFGIKVSDVSADVSLIFDRKDRIVQQLRKGVETLLKAKKITLIKGQGRIVSPTQVAVQNEKINSKFIILATGSEPAGCSGFEVDGKSILTSTELLDTAAIPKSLLIIGGGVTGCEMACFYSEVGSKVYIVEMLDRILPTEDIEISKTFLMFLKKMGVEVFNGTKVKSAKLKTNGLVDVELEDRIIQVEKVLLSVGRKSNCENIGLEDVGIKTKNTRPVVDEYMRTNIPTVFAVGDLVGKRYLAHAASKEGIVAVENILGKHIKMNYNLVPNCIFTFPEIASIGLTEEQAKEANIQVKSSRFPFQALGRAVASNQTQGFVKIISESQTGEVLGCQIIGPYATELIAQVCVAMRMEATVREIVDTIYAHPTFSEAVQEAAMGSLEGALHLV